MEMGMADGFFCRNLKEEATKAQQDDRKLANDFRKFRKKANAFQTKLLEIVRWTNGDGDGDGDGEFTYRMTMCKH